MVGVSATERFRSGVHRVGRERRRGGGGRGEGEGGGGGGGGGDSEAGVSHSAAAIVEVEALRTVVVKTTSALQRARGTCMSAFDTLVKRLPAEALAELEKALLKAELSELKAELSDLATKTKEEALTALGDMADSVFSEDAQDALGEVSEALSGPLLGFAKDLMSSRTNRSKMQNWRVREAAAVSAQQIVGLPPTASRLTTGEEARKPTAVATSLRAELMRRRCFETSSVVSNSARRARRSHRS